MRVQVEAALTALQRQSEERQAQLRARAMRSEQAAKEEELRQLRLESEVYENFRLAFASPSIRVDVAGAVFVSPVNPFAK